MATKRAIPQTTEAPTPKRGPAKARKVAITPELPPHAAAAPVERGPGRPRKVPTDEPPLVITREVLAQRLGVSRVLTYTMQDTDPDFPVPMRIGGQARFAADAAERYVATKLAQATERHRTKTKDKAA